MSSTRADAGSSTSAQDVENDYAGVAVPDHAKRGPGAVSVVLLGIVTAFFFPAVGGTYLRTYGAQATWIGLAIGFGILISLVLVVSATASRQGLTAELITRGCGYGYVGTVLTTLIYAVTFIIMAATEAQILANAAVQLVPDIPVHVWYVVVGAVFIPLTWYGMRFLPRMMWVTMPVYAVLVTAALLVAVTRTGDSATLAPAGTTHGALGVIGVLAGLSGIIGLNPFEASDYTRFIPARRFRSAVPLALLLPYALMFFVAYPMGMFFATVSGGSTDPAVYFTMFLGLGFGVLLAWVSQVRINVTNVHLASIALTTVSERLAPSRPSSWKPGRKFWSVIVSGVTVTLMFADVLGNILVFLEWNGVFLLAWAGSIVSDLVVVRRLLRVVPTSIEYRESHIRRVNPVGVTALVVGCLIGTALLLAGGPVLSGLSAYIGFLAAAVVHAVLAYVTGGRYYTRADADADADADAAPGTGSGT